jgi:hypothetical protein
LRFSDKQAGMKIYYSRDEILRLIEGFENRTLPKEQWTHQAHLVMAVWYLSKLDAAAATEIIRSRIKKYNEAVGGENTDTSGYHETITLFYIWYIKKYLSTADPNRSLVELTNSFFTLHGDKNLPFEYYSKDLLMSVAARRDWVEPDLKSFS